MKSWQLVIAGLLLSAVAGCRTDPNIEILERELRRKEDEIYRLQWALEDLQDTSTCGARWDSTPSAPAAESSRDVDAEGEGGGAPAIELPGRPSKQVPESLRSPSGSLPGDVPEVPEHLRGPSPETKVNGPSFERQYDAPARRSDDEVSVALPLLDPPIRPSGDSSRVATIALNPVLTGGLNLGGDDGDQGLLAVVEPRDEHGRPVDAPAEIAVVALDPAIVDADGKASRIARWEFTAEETAEFFRRVGPTTAIHLMMAWPERRPKHNKLRLFVRYETADGRKLQADMPIEIALPGERVSRWTPTELDPPERRRSPPLDARRVEPPPRTSIPEAEPRLADRRGRPKPKRPVWSPERPK